MRKSLVSVVIFKVNHQIGENQLVLQIFSTVCAVWRRISFYLLIMLTILKYDKNLTLCDTISLIMFINLNSSLFIVFSYLWINTGRKFDPQFLYCLLLNPHFL